MFAPRIQLGQAGGALLPLTILEELVVEQALNRHWRCTLTLHAAPESRPDVEELHGESLRIGALDAEGAETVLFEGFVRRVRLRYEIGGEYRVLLEAVSPSWRLDQGGRFCYYRQQTARAAAAATLGHCGLSLAGSMPEGATLSYVQWEEADFPFFARLVDDGEAWFRPATDGAAAVEVQTAFQPGTQLLWRDPEEGLFHWADGGRLRTLTTGGAHYDPQVGLSRALTGVSSSADFYGGAAARMVAAVQTGAGSLGDRQAGRPRSATLADHLRSAQHESRRASASAVTCEGRSQNPRVRAGDAVEVVGLPGVNGVYGVVEAEHRWTHKGYENRFLATPAKRWLPAERPLRPSLDGLYPARVTANHDPHNQGRIRVSYYWQDGGETTWVRLLAPHAGPGRGFLFLPEIGDEVLICFEEGDPERPYVVGSAWNGVHQPPTSGFHVPGEPNGAEFVGNNIKRLVTKSGHRITMVDTPGKETVSIATPSKNKLVLTEYHADTGRPAIVLATAGDLILSAPNGRIHSHSATHSREVGESQAKFVLAAYVPPVSSSAIPAAATPVDKPKWVHYKDSSTACAKYDRMTDGEKKAAKPTDKTAIPGGPAYTTVGAPLSDYTGWKDQGISDSKACVIKGIAANEGNDFSAVQSYDSQTLSAGSMQKTINLGGSGELPQQLLKFQQSNPEKYKTLFADKGWTAEAQEHGPPIAYFQDPDDSDAPKLTGTALQNYIRKCDGSNFEKTMQPWRDAGQDPDFQKLQVKDYATRLNDTTSQAVYQNGKNTGYRIGHYISSSRGLAHLADYGVNSGMGRPTISAGLQGQFGAALQKYTEAAKPPDDPSQWSDAQRADLLNQFKISTGSDSFGKDGKPLNDRTRRWQNIETKSGDCLSDQGGSL